jgi:hypothetical protein
LTLIRRTTALLLLAALISPGVGLARQSEFTAAGPTLELSGAVPIFSSFSESLAALFGLLHGAQGQNQGMPSRERPLPERKAPKLPPTKAEREAKVAGIRVDLPDELTIESGQRRILMAIPLDKDGNAIHGLLAEWESSDKNIIAITKEGRAVAGNPGKARLTVGAGQKKVSVKVSVIEAREQPKAIVGRAVNTLQV